MINGITPQIESILAAGNQAPSGENCQPWRFTVRGNDIDVYLVPERDQSYYGWGQRASYMACGAAIENMMIAATAVGFLGEVAYLPGAENLVATISLKPMPGMAVDELEPHIFLRTTNRKKFMPIKLSDNEKTQLTAAAEKPGEAVLTLIDAREDVQRLAKVGSTNEVIMLSNEALHGFFFSHVNWTKEEDTLKKIGFYIKTLELSSAAVAAFYVVRNWSVMNALLAIGFDKVVGSQNAAVYASSASIGALVLRGSEPLDFIKAGRALERMWLTATKLGFYIQPLTGVLFFKLKIDGGEGNVFSDSQRSMIESEYMEAQRIFGCPDKRIGFMFRIGSGEAPSAHSVRFALQDVVTVA